MSTTSFPPTDLDAGVAAVKRDLLSDSGPQISTMRNHNFAILPYRPAEEYRLRAKINGLVQDLKAGGWDVLSIALQKLLFDRLRGLGQEPLDNIIAREKRLYAKAGGPNRALAHLSEKLSPHIDGPEGLAADVARVIAEFLDDASNDAKRTVVFIGRAGALYPFFRTSALLKHIAGKTRNVPVILLYPGERRDVTALSFMGELAPDRDYRPRIYP